MNDEITAAKKAGQASEGWQPESDELLILQIGTQKAVGAYRRKL
jgi:hypothetical protein